MSRMRVLGSGLLVGALVLGAAACGKDEEKATKNDRGAINFADPPAGSTDLGLCYAYDITQIKELIGGGNTFKRLPPSAIGKKGDPVHGEVCAWERTEPNGDTSNLRIEARKYEDPATLASQFDDLRDGTLDSKSVPDLGAVAFSSSSKETSLLQIRTDEYLLTLSSRGTGKLDPVDLDDLKLLAAAGLEQLP